MRNLVLFLILVFMVTFVYFFEEKKNIQLNEEQVKREQLFNTNELGEIKRIKAENFIFYFESGKVTSSSNLQISNVKVESFLKNLEKINVTRIFTPQEQSELGQFDVEASLNLFFENAEVQLDIGLPTKFDTTFYMRIISNKSAKIVLARYTGELLNQVAFDGESSKLAPWQEVRRIFKSTELSFHKDNPFEDLEFNQVVIKTFRSPEYVLDLDKNQTSPEVFKGLEYDQNSFLEYKRITGIKSLMSEKISKDPEQELVSISINNRIFKVFKKYLGRSGYFIKSDDTIYEISGSDFRKIAPPLQSFWKKNVKINLLGQVKVYDINKKVVSNGVLDKTNKLFGLLDSQAHSVSLVSTLPKQYLYRIEQGSLSYLVVNTQDGSEVYDENFKLMYLFLKKLE